MNASGETRKAGRELIGVVEECEKDIGVLGRIDEDQALRRRFERPTRRAPINAHTEAGL
jgi:hypothetical protein